MDADVDRLLHHGHHVRDRRRVGGPPQPDGLACPGHGGQDAVVARGTVRLRPGGCWALGGAHRHRDAAEEGGRRRARGGSSDFIDAIIVELIFSTTIAFVALNCMASSRANPPGDRNQYFALAVGFVAIAGGYCTNDISGAFLNPAATVGFGVTSKSALSAVGCYVACQLLAANAAVILYFMVRPEELEEVVEDVVDGLSCERAFRALAFCGARRRAEDEGGAAPDSEGGPGAEVPKAHMYENYAVQVSARWLAELLGTYVVTFTFVLATVNQQMAAEHSAVGQAQRNATEPVLVHMPHVHGHAARGATPIGTQAADTHSSSSVAWATGAAMLSLAYALGGVSGSHFNPAVTLAVLLSRRPGCLVAEGTSFVLAQSGAAICAALTVCMLHRSGNSMFNKDRVVDMGPNTEDGYGWAALISGEAIFTAATALVVMCMMTVKSPRYPKASSTRSFQFALVTGMCYTAGSYAMEGISHGHLNPAFSLGIATSNFISSGFQAVNSQALLYYVAAQALGSVGAAMAFVVVHPHEYKMDPLMVGQQLAADCARDGLERRPLARSH
ncbi:unnamed protein product [Prorocentrum cordatum]|uniref:Aquaporin n=1 Tax=Prorocentrum cordatum TaxID=2364126 RepID=A0ABN9SHX2_9DINO|nr:unnamed protein product [Polarella glacialis]